MIIHILENSEELGKNAASLTAQKLRDAIDRKGTARLLVSTGASQFDTLSALVKEDVNWNKVEMFHLDEYVGIDETHKASFRKYLKERLISKVNFKATHLVDGTGDIQQTLEALTAIVRKAVIDVGLIGIGENSHIAFNDPPADFECEDAYKLVTLDERCKRQQVREGWFKTVDDVPKQAISMTVKQILACESIISCVPYSVKAQAVKDTLYEEISPMVPATILKTHKDWNLFLDRSSAALVVR
jgi:glucosamine-6-phosphate deaminase